MISFLILTNGPPEFPGLIGTSICRYALIPFGPILSVAETMPSVPMETPAKQKGFAWGRGKNTSKGRYEKNS